MSTHFLISLSFKGGSLSHLLLNVDWSLFQWIEYDKKKICSSWDNVIQIVNSISVCFSSLDLTPQEKPCHQNHMPRKLTLLPRTVTWACKWSLQTQSHLKWLHIGWHLDCSFGKNSELEPCKWAAAVPRFLLTPIPQQKLRNNVLF